MTQKAEIQTTADGSHTVSVNGITYHSIHGAVAESNHVFINAGLLHCVKGHHETIHMLEMGFGTGLNALLTLIQSNLLQQKISYTTIETNPLEPLVVEQLNYGTLLQQKENFNALHTCSWNNECLLNEFFAINKQHTTLQNFLPDKKFHLVYFDAFAPTAQPELWTEEIFSKLYQQMTPHAVLVTYCSKGMVRRVMQSAGFMVEKLPGPPHKREMLRAIKKQGSV